MKSPALFLMILVLTIPVIVSAQPPACYHSLEELHEFIFDLESNYPDLVKVDSVGHSQQDNNPIYLVKVSDNVQVDEDEPTAIIFAHIHAEEIMGIEVAIEAMRKLVTDDHREYRLRRNGLEIYFMFTMNPDGLEVVFGDNQTGDLVHGADVTFRKNKRFTTPDNVFHYQTVRGNDTSGVDLNRNFDLHFFNGDTLMHWVDEAERYDYYRGETPFSESETQAVRDVVYKIRPMYSVTFHSSRTGNFSEKVFYPWDWSGDLQKMAPDQDLLDDVGNNMALMLPKQQGGFYTPLRSAGRNGKMHDWMYAAGGWVNMQTEIGNRVIQPEENVKEDIVEDVVPAVFYLFDRALGLDDIDGDTGYLEVHAMDESSNPLVTEVLLPDFNNGYLKPRMTDPEYGTLRRPLLARNYSVVTRAWGYKPDTSMVNVGTFGASRHNVTLLEEEKAFLYLRSFEGQTENPIDATYIISHMYGRDTLTVDGGEIDLNWPIGDYRIEVHSDGYIPEVYNVNLTENQLLVPYLDQITSESQEGFENGLAPNWTTGGDFDWTIGCLDVRSGGSALKSGASTIDPLLPFNSEGWIEVEYDVPDDAMSLALFGFNAIELEPDYDFCYVEMMDENGVWQEIDRLNGYHRWEHFVYDLNSAIDRESVKIRWRVVTDGTDKDRGVFLDDLDLLVSTSNVSAPENDLNPHKWSLEDAYPNPFNPTTNIVFNVAEASHVSVIIYDILGREILNLVNKDLKAGTYKHIADLSNNASGLYFVKMEGSNFSQVKKLVLLK